MMKKKEKNQIKDVADLKYEITMYKLLSIFAASILITLAIGFYSGKVVGYSQGVDDVHVNIPDYCVLNKEGNVIEISCLEVSNITAGDLCRMLSTPLENKIKVMIVP